MSTPTFLGLEALIIARLEKTACKATRAQALPLADLSMIYDPSLPIPSIRVSYYGHAVIDDLTQPPEGWGHFEQTWLVVPAVRNVHGIRAGTSGRAEISLLCDSVLDGLANWRPGGGYGVLRNVAPPASPLSDGGCTFIPFAFSSRFMRRLEC